MSIKLKCLILNTQSNENGLTWLAVTKSFRHEICGSLNPSNFRYMVENDEHESVTYISNMYRSKEKVESRTLALYINV